MNTQELYREFSALYEHVSNKAKEPPDTSRDGVSILETEDGSCVQVISNGNTMLCSFDFYEKLIKSKKLLKEMTK